MPTKRHGAADAAEEISPRYFGWRVVFACFLMALCAWGFAFYGHAVYLTELQRLHGWSTSLISGASTVTLLTGGVLVVFANDIIERVGARTLVIGGAGIVALSLVLLGFASSPWQLYLAYLLMSFAWISLGTPAITIVLSYWFQHRRGFAMSLALNGASFGGIVIAPLLLYLISATGFRNTMFVAAALVAVLLIPSALAWIVPPAAGADATKAENAPGAMTKGEALRDPTFMLLAGTFAVGLVAQVGFLVHQVAFLQSIMGTARAGLAVALTTLMAVVGRVALGSVIDSFDPRRATAATFASQAAVFAAMTFTTDVISLLILCCVFGFSAGNLLTLPQVTIQKEFAPASFGTLVALASAIVTLVAAGGPWLIGLVRDATGGYEAGLWLCAGLDALAAAVVLIRPKREA
jgi:predicted MFS family arabinose efflux permease